jgi:hypothetical protein
VNRPSYSGCTIYDAERLGHDDARLGKPAQDNPFDDWFRACAYAYGHAAATDKLCERIVEQAQLAGVPRAFRDAQGGE